MIKNPETIFKKKKIKILLIDLLGVSTVANYSLGGPD